MMAASSTGAGSAELDRLTYWLVRLSEALQRLNRSLLRVGSSPGEFASLMSGPEFEATSLGREIRMVAHAMRRFAAVLDEPGAKAQGEALTIWEDLMASLRLMLSACALDSELWLSRAPAEPAVLGELSATVHAIEGLCGRFERLH